MPTNKKQNKNKKKAGSSSSAGNDKKVPLECTNDEFQDFLMAAQSLTVKEARTEIIECARYGEIDAVRAILDIWSKPEKKI